MLPPFTWVTVNRYINCQVVLSPILNDRPLDPQSPALPSELSATDHYGSVSQPLGPVPLAGPNSIYKRTKSLFKLTFFKKITVHIQNSGTKKTFILPQRDHQP